MKLSLLRIEMKRSIPPQPVKVYQRTTTAVAQHCVVSRDVSHWKCTEPWCECPCHDSSDDMNMWCGL